jgi:glyoxylase-like metal-dependent hydrolase (beta-lactamase superfamily II)
MEKWKTKNGTVIIRVLSERSNAYLVIKEQIVILIDTGKTNAFQTLLKNLVSLDIKVEDISFIILTHTHYDHCQSARKIKEKSNCQIIVSGKAADSVKNGYTKLPRGTFWITEFIAATGRLIGKSKFGYEPFQPDILITGDYNLDVEGVSIKITETPGHSDDSVSIIVENEIAVVGDEMLGVIRNSVFPPFADDVLKMLASWHKLLETGCNIFLPGHGKEINRAVLQKEFEKYERKYNSKFSLLF